MDAAFARRAPAWPLLATLGVHLLLAWSWRVAHPPAPDTHGERIIELLPVAPPVREIPRMRPQPPLPRTPTPAAPRARTDIAPAGTPRDPEPVTPPPEAPATVADPFAITAPSAPAASASESMAGRARREAGSVDRELRKGKSGVPDVAETPMARFRETLDAAYKDRGLGVTSETYTAPDGQVIYRFRVGGRYRCRSGGGVGPKIGGAVGGGEVLFDVQGGAGRAGEVPCPSHAEWKRD